MHVNTITVLGLGAGDLDQLPLGVYKTLVKAQRLYVRTAEHPVLQELGNEGITYKSFDEIYEKHDGFEAVYQEIVETLITLAQSGPLFYAVPGHPLVAEQTVQWLVDAEKEGRIQLEIVGGQSFLDPIFNALRIDPIEGFQLLDGTMFKRDDVHMSQHVLIAQVYDAYSASDVKLTLMEKYPEDYLVTIVTAAGTSEEVLRVVPLFELDRATELNNLTTIYVPPVSSREERIKEWSTFREIITKLRAPDGCPWDREQTHETLKKYLIEEVHEFLQAVNDQDDDGMIEELGDVLLQVFLHAQIGEDNGYFSLEDVLESVSSKMIHRHPHVFSDVEVEGTEDVLRNWQQLKSVEKGNHKKRILEGQERSESSLLTSYNFQKSAAKVGFDWPNAEGAWLKFDEEWQEFKHEITGGTATSQLDELGDVLFTIVNVARFYGLSPEEAMMHANRKFKTRFHCVEDSVAQGKGEFSAYTLNELEKFWQQAKQIKGDV
ncbi:bifunctional methyltransferase/pyrophosphohydrolase YabN [Paenisporosarcina antarctica]|uniref:nucleoside triphosphate pyrophosphohydrolase n=1 Tax=Paenisporosarcina antarctica TaxID=417367 RepID=UPI001AB01F71|nr:nucleoside triphosphate pyrophosphohydrolase [Paenisporosarcina antarctica]